MFYWFLKLWFLQKILLAELTTSLVCFKQGLPQRQMERWGSQRSVHWCASHAPTTSTCQEGGQWGIRSAMPVHFSGTSQPSKHTNQTQSKGLLWGRGSWGSKEISPVCFLYPLTTSPILIKQNWNLLKGSVCHKRAQSRAKTENSNSLARNSDPCASALHASLTFYHLPLWGLSCPLSNCHN